MSRFRRKTKLSEADKTPLTGREFSLWRISRQLNQASLAKTLGISERTLRRIEDKPDAPVPAHLALALKWLHGTNLVRRYAIIHLGIRDLAGDPTTTITQSVPPGAFFQIGECPDLNLIILVQRA